MEKYETLEQALKRIHDLEYELAKNLVQMDMLREDIDHLKYKLSKYEDDYVPNEDERFEEYEAWQEKQDNLEMGYDPYLGCYTDDV